MEIHPLSESLVPALAVTIAKFILSFAIFMVNLLIASSTHEVPAVTVEKNHFQE
jgi:hypothetical protein